MRINEPKADQLGRVFSLSATFPADSTFRPHFYFSLAHAFYARSKIALLWHIPTHFLFFSLLLLGLLLSNSTPPPPPWPPYQLARKVTSALVALVLLAFALRQCWLLAWVASPLFAVLFVVLLYVWSDVDQTRRDLPHTIKRRFVSVAAIVLFALVYAHQWWGKMSVETEVFGLKDTHLHSSLGRHVRE